MVILFIAVTAYIIGSIPAGYIAGRMRGVDIRNLGSGNIGATNVLRTLGKRYGYPVFLFDFSKGLISVALAIFIFKQSDGPIGRDLCEIVAGVGAVVGHSYPVWLRFRGGKGVATSLGVLFCLIPLAAVIAVAVWLLVFWTSRYVSIASITSAVVLPVATGAIIYLRGANSAALVYFAACLAVLIVWRHRANISRLLNGTEPRFTRQ
jgi:glycerol-3-phosphate acyltransferase PlsY